MSNLSRKKFLFSGLSLAAVTAFFFKREIKPEEKKKTTTFLTQDGRLVEIEADKLPTSRKAATKEDLQNWIKK